MIRFSLVALGFCVLAVIPVNGQEAAPAPERQLRIFRLEHSLPSDLANELFELQPNAVFVPQDRSFQLIVRGEAKDLEELEQLIQACDIPPRQPESIKPQYADNTASRQQAESKAAVEADRLRAEVAALSARNETLAKQMRAISEKDKTPTVEPTGVRNRLQEAVEKEFDLRLSVQQSELLVLRNRLSLIEARIGRQKAMRQQIVAKRVSELLTGASAVRTPPPVELPAPPTSAASPRNPFAASFVPTPSSSDAAFILGSPEEFRKRLSETSDVLNMLKDDQSVDDPATDDSPVSRALKNAEADYAAARRAFEAQIRLLKLEYDFASREVEMSRRKLAETAKMAKAGVASSQELAEAQIKSERIALRAEKARTLLQLYSDILSTKDPSDSPDTSDSSSENETSAEDPFGSPSESSDPFSAQIPGDADDRTPSPGVVTEKEGRDDRARN